MKRKINTAVSCIVFIVLLVLAIGKCADLLEDKKARQKYTPFFESETNFDVIFLGTSHMWNHVLPMEMWEEYGIASYNWAYANCTPAETYYLIQDILKYTNPKVVVIDLYGLIEYDDYGNGKYRTDRIEQQHVQFDALPLSRSKVEASQDVFDDYDNNEDFIWNFIMYHNRWSELGQSDFDYSITTEKGAQLLTGLGEANFNPISTDEKTEIDSVCYSYFLKFLEYCEERDIKVLCTYLPYAAGKSQQKVANSVEAVIENYSGCEYENMLYKDIINFQTDIYSDNGHINYSGALKITKWLGNYLTEHYELDDYSQNGSWVQDDADYYEYKVTNLKKQTLLINYLVLLTDPDFTASVEIYDEKLETSERLMTLFENAGIEPNITKTDTEYCAKLSIVSNINQELIEEIYFTNSSTTNWNITKIVEAN